MPDEKSADERLSVLEQNTGPLVKLIMEQNAFIFALASMIKEFAEHEGIPKSEAGRLLRQRQLYFQDLNLRRLEDKNPSLAARIDTRSVLDLELPDEVERLFPNQ